MTSIATDFDLDELLVDPDVPVLKTSLDEATATRDSTDIASGVPAGEAAVMHQPTVSVQEAFSLQGEKILDSGVSEPMTTQSTGLPSDDPVTVPGAPEPKLPGQGEGGPTAELATLAAWAAVLTAAVFLLNRVGVLSW